VTREIGHKVDTATGHRGIESQHRSGFDPLMGAVLHAIVWLCLAGLLLARAPHAAPPPG